MTQQRAPQRHCVIFLGPPGAGKGTQAARLAQRLGYVHVASGVLLRENVTRGSALGQEADQYMRAGDLVPEHLVTKLVVDAVETTSATGVVLDGYPKNKEQALIVDSVLLRLGFDMGLAVYLNGPFEVLRDRLLARGREANRADDTPEVIEQRLRKLSAPPEDLLDHYENGGRLRTIDGDQTLSAVSASIDHAVNDYLHGTRV